MSLKNFGGVLDFAIEMEKEDALYLQEAIKNKECNDCSDFLKRFEKESQKNAKILTRARQENVTEMILEAIPGLEPEQYRVDKADPKEMSKDELLAVLKKLENNAERFYLEAAEKIRPISDVASTFKRLAKKRKERARQISDMLL